MVVMYVLAVKRLFTYKLISRFGGIHTGIAACGVFKRHYLSQAKLPGVNNHLNGGNSIDPGSTFHSNVR